ncbi:MAG: InlB B-repeat-containing protein, partial [Christensenella sp.]
SIKIAAPQSITQTVLVTDEMAPKVEYTAHFKEKQTVVNFSASSGGTVSSEPTTQGNVLRVNKGTIVTLTATPNAGYTLQNWVKDGVVLTTEKANTYTFTADTDVCISANFVKPVNVTLEASAGGSIDVISGGTPVGNVLSCNAGTTVVLKAAGNNGYRFTGWYKDDVPILGAQAISDVYQFTATENCKISARFVKCTYIISLAAQPAEGGTLICEGKTPDEKGCFTVDENEALTLSVTAAPQYALKQLKENDVPVMVQNGKYVFTATKDMNFVAKFEKVLATIDAAAIPAAGGTVEYAKPFVKIGEMTTVGAAENAEYVFAGWMENGAIVSTDKSYTFMVKGDTKLSALFKKKNYTVTVTSGEHGVTSPSGALFVR